ncbi:unnamed protein product, partial [Ceratitis capitata]
AAQAQRPQSLACRFGATLKNSRDENLEDIFARLDFANDDSTTATHTEMTKATQFFIFFI